MDCSRNGSGSNQFEVKTRPLKTKDLGIPEQVTRTLKAVHDGASHEAKELKLALDRMKRIEGTLKNLISALTDSRVFSALDLVEKEGELLAEYWLSRGQDPAILRDIDSQLQEAARRAWLDYPKLLEEECRDAGLELDSRSRHPNYLFADGFLVVKVKKQGRTVIAAITSNQRKLAEFPADVQAVGERVEKEGEHLFGRPYENLGVTH